MYLLRRLYASLYVQLCACQEVRNPMMYLPDDATEEELAELAADQRERAAEQRERATTDLAGRTAHAIRYANDAVAQHRRMQQAASPSGYGSDIAELNN